MISQIIQSLKEEPSRNAKMAILEKHREVELLKQVFEATLNPYTNYYIRKIPNYTPSGKKTLDEVLPLLEKLSLREVTGHDAISFLADEILGKLSADDAYIIERVLQKNLDCGVQTPTVNKIWKGLIPTYPCLLANGYNEKNIKNIVFPAYSQLKLDGMRANVFCVRGKVTVRGRSGKVIDLLGALDEDVARLLAQDDNPGIVLDGELILVEKDGSVMPRKKGNGILNKAIKGTISLKEAQKVRIRVWDALPLREFMQAKTVRHPYYKRFSLVQDIVSGKSNNEGFISEKVEAVENVIVNSLEEAQSHFQDALSRGEEGTILKNKDHPWENRRSKHLVKMKAEKEADLVVVDWQEGTGKYVGMLGALICQTSDGKVEVSVGSGYSDKQREELTKDATLGKVVTVLYNERITSKGKDRQDVDSLFLPRFVEVREDKTVANSSEEVE